MSRVSLTLFACCVLLAAACGTSSQEAQLPDQPNDSETLLPECSDPSEETTDEADQTLSYVVSENCDYSQFDYEAEPTANALVEGYDNEAFPPAVIEIDNIFSGGVGADQGIPAIDEPQFAPIADISFIEDDDEPVLSVEVNGEAVAFPLQILIVHEIVNTEIGGTPVTVTYCPLCNSALTFDRQVGARLLDFGVSGSLFNSSLLMYDRQTGSLWTHFNGQGAVGHYAGVQLDLIPTQTVSYGKFVEAHPDGKVLTQDNEHNRQSQYGRNGYVGEDTSDGTSGALFRGEVDERLPRKERVVGLLVEGASLAVPFTELEKQPVQEVTEGDVKMVVFYEKGLASPVDQPRIADGRDVGQSGVFTPEADRQELTFTSETNGVFVDDQTSSTWNIFGQATAGPLEGEQLESIPHVDSFWFSWAAYRPDTQIVTA